MTVLSTGRAAVRPHARPSSSLSILFALTLVLSLPVAAQAASSHGGSHGGGSHGGSHSGGHTSGGHTSGGHTSHGGHSGGHDFDGGFHGGFHGFHGGFGGFHGFFYPSFSLDFGFPYYYPYYGGYYDGNYAPGAYGTYGRPGAYDREHQGALDLDLSPADTQVYLNGELVGTVDDFDGWPQYLWLDQGTYDVVFYRPGYKTLARQVTIYPGLVINWDDHLERGESVRPEDLQTKSHDRRDARVEQDREMQDQADRNEQQQGRYGQGWRDRVRQDRAERDRSGDAGDQRPGDQAGDRVRMHLQVSPADASVYLDGRFVGTAQDLASRPGLQVSPGDHTLSVVRPGRHAEERHFTATEGEDVQLQIDLHGE